MRTVPLFLVIVGVAGTLGTAHAQAPANMLEGTWEMVSRETVYTDSTVTESNFPGPSYKLLNSTHFAFGRQTIRDGEVQDDVYAGGGRYTIQGDTLYTEHIEYHSSAGLVGISIPFQVRVEGDLWYHTGRIGNFLLKEVWRRVQEGETMNLREMGAGGS